MLELSQALTYTAALGVAAAIPGPGMAALVARSVSGGALPGFSLLSGLILGDLVYLSFAVFGLSLIAHYFDALFVLVRACAAVYLGYLAWQFWWAEPQPVVLGRPINKRELFSAWLSGLTITLGNPKTIAFYLALLPLVINLESVSLHTWSVVLVPLTIAVLFIVGGLFVLGAVRIRHLLASPRAQHYLFRGAALMMLGAALAMLAQNL
ncbi:LysE family translocator [Pseudomonas helleri]|uniref:LysE family translocator n=1 Tax=Pseudomonas helleri TaxID=1608996 RepID=UPI00242A6AAF|nr:LysE family translocator [Pseudomonas helleri]